MTEHIKEDNRDAFFKAINGALVQYETSARKTGRTAALIEKMQDGDTLLVHTIKFAGYAQSMARNMGKNIVVLHVESTAHLHQRMNMDMRGMTTNIHFDHELLRILYADHMAGFERLVETTKNRFKPWTEMKKEPQ